AHTHTHTHTHSHPTTTTTTATTATTTAQQHQQHLQQQQMQQQQPGSPAMFPAASSFTSASASTPTTPVVVHGAQQGVIPQSFNPYSSAGALPVSSRSLPGSPIPGRYNTATPMSDRRLGDVPVLSIPPPPSAPPPQHLRDLSRRRQLSLDSSFQDLPSSPIAQPRLPPQGPLNVNTFAPPKPKTFTPQQKMSPMLAQREPSIHERRGVGVDNVGAVALGPAPAAVDIAALLDPNPRPSRSSAGDDPSAWSGFGGGGGGGVASFVTPDHVAPTKMRNIGDITGPTLLSTSSTVRTIPIHEIQRQLDLRRRSSSASQNQNRQPRDPSPPPPCPRHARLECGWVIGKTFHRPGEKLSHAFPSRGAPEEWDANAFSMPTTQGGPRPSLLAPVVAATSKTLQKGASAASSTISSIFNRTRGGSTPSAADSKGQQDMEYTSKSGQGGWAALPSDSASPYSSASTPGLGGGAPAFIPVSPSPQRFPPAFQPSSPQVKYKMPQVPPPGMPHQGSNSAPPNFSPQVLSSSSSASYHSPSLYPSSHQPHFAAAAAAQDASPHSHHRAGGIYGSPGGYGGGGYDAAMAKLSRAEDAAAANGW
ncbi:hypothetical protein DFJ73DRAFT_908293, partial [Zopfochytrium polystomum]